MSKTCPDCNGSGEVLREGAHPHDPDAPVFRCENCDGSGEYHHGEGCACDECCDGYAE